MTQLNAPEIVAIKNQLKIDFYKKNEDYLIDSLKKLNEMLDGGSLVEIKAHLNQMADDLEHVIPEWNNKIKSAHIILESIRTKELTDVSEDSPRRFLKAMNKASFKTTLGLPVDGLMAKFAKSQLRDYAKCPKPISHPIHAILRDDAARKIYFGEGSALEVSNRLNDAPESFDKMSKLNELGKELFAHYWVDAMFNSQSSALYSDLKISNQHPDAYALAQTTRDVRSNFAHLASPNLSESVYSYKIPDSAGEPVFGSLYTLIINNPSLSADTKQDAYKALLDLYKTVDDIKSTATYGLPIIKVKAILATLDNINSKNAKQATNMLMLLSQRLGKKHLAQDRQNRGEQYLGKYNYISQTNQLLASLDTLPTAFAGHRELLEILIWQYLQNAALNNYIGNLFVVLPAINNEVAKMSISSPEDKAWVKAFNNQLASAKSTIILNAIGQFFSWISRFFVVKRNTNTAVVNTSQPAIEEKAKPALPAKQSEPVAKHESPLSRAPTAQPKELMPVEVPVSLPAKIASIMMPMPQLEHVVPAVAVSA